MRNIIIKMAAGGFMVALTGLTGCSGGSNSAGTPALLPLETTCTELVGRKFNEVTVTSATWFAASGSEPAFCQVKGTRAPYLDIEVDVPEGWSGRLWQQGGAGLDGRMISVILTDTVTKAEAMSLAMKNGRAVYAASNGGNRVTENGHAAPQVWVNGTLEGLLSAKDYAYEALNTTREFAKAVTKSFYGKLPDYTYFNGCSNGGRNAYIAAERWPLEYDGIVSGCMSMDTEGQAAAWMNLGARNGTPAMPTDAQWKDITHAAIVACDALDGVTDGIIANQSACKFDAGTLLCGQTTARADSATCLTAEQVQTVKDIMSDLKLANGATIYSGFTWADWASYSTKWGALGGGFGALATGDLAWYDDSVKQQSFALDHDYYLFQYGLRTVGASVDISKVASYVASGKKMISWHSGSDNLVSLNDHTRNYSKMTDRAKGLGLANPSTNTRFFVLPGASHGEGFFLTQVNWFDAITNWVEKGIPPEQLVYNRVERDKEDPLKVKLRTLPVCQHPKYPRYKGTGDINVAESFICTNP